jgi:hypothetical protein
MRSKKDAKTVIIVTGPTDQVDKILRDNSAFWEAISPTELEHFVTELAASNRAGRRGGIRCPVDRAPCDREIKACCSCSRNKGKK